MVYLWQLKSGIICPEAERKQLYWVDTSRGHVKDIVLATRKALEAYKDGGDMLSAILGALRPESFQNNISLSREHAMVLHDKCVRLTNYLEENGYRIVDMNHKVIVRLKDGTEISGAVVDLALEDANRKVEHIILTEKTNFSVKAKKRENMIEYSPAVLALAATGISNISIWTLSSKADTSTFFAERFDEAEGKKGTLFGKQIVHAPDISPELANERLAEMLAEYSGKRNCSECRMNVLCNSYTEFRHEKREQTLPAPVRNFTPEQEQVIGHRKGNLVVFAGPGSGKTAVLVERFTRMLREGISPANILLVVFSNKVAAEIRERVASALSYSRERVAALNIFTLNAFGQKVINENEQRWPIRPTVATTVERKEIIRALLFPPDGSENELIALRHRYRNLYGGLGGLERLVRILEHPDQIERNYEPEDASLLLELGKQYSEVLEKNHRISYREQITYPLAFLLEDAKVCSDYQSLYKHIMVDEAQDLDEVQYQLLCQLYGDKGSMVLVGDDDQSVYDFRDGSPKHMRAFAKTSEVVYLTENFRSTQEIGSSAVSLLVDEKERVDKQFSFHANGAKPVVIEEPDCFAELVKQMVASGVHPTDIAVIARKNSTLEMCGALLEEQGISTTKKDYLREDTVFLFCKDVLTLVYHTGNEKLAKYRLMKLLIGDVPLSLEDEFLSSYIGDIRSKLLMDAPEAVLANALMMLGVEQHPAMEKIAEVAELKQFTAQELLSYLESMELLEDDTRVGYETRDDAVQLVTAHDSKGKEYACVIIYDTEVYDETPQEQRLLYVAMTRAKRLLYLVTKEITPAVAKICDVVKAS